MQMSERPNRAEPDAAVAARIADITPAAMADELFEGVYRTWGWDRFARDAAAIDVESEPPPNEPTFKEGLQFYLEPTADLLQDPGTVAYLQRLVGMLTEVWGHPGDTHGQ
jgi:hypothetical protein